MGNAVSAANKFRVVVDRVVLEFKQATEACEDTNLVKELSVRCQRSPPIHDDDMRVRDCLESAVASKVRRYLRSHRGNRKDFYDQDWDVWM